MPYDDRTEEEEDLNRKYIMTHGKWTIMGSFKTSTEARVLLDSLDDYFIKDKIRTQCEAEMKKFWPKFDNRFKYIGWKGAVVAKLKTNKEFRSAITFEKDGVIHIIPGKVSNIFDAGYEVLALIEKRNILHSGNYRYVKEGELDRSMNEIQEKPDPHLRNTCNLQTYQELQGQAAAIPILSPSSAEQGPSQRGVAKIVSFSRALNALPKTNNHQFTAFSSSLPSSFSASSPNKLFRRNRAKTF